MPFVVLDADRVVARVRVVEVRRHLSAALIEENRGNQALEAGLAARVIASE
ncbi:MAG: hypothetical protein GTO62_18515 [Planctomycetales bacterium]|nr:hypothetical protein [Planctomycetales bacterium]